LIDNHAASLPRDRNKVQSFFIFFPTALLSPSPDESALRWVVNCVKGSDNLASPALAIHSTQTHNTLIFSILYAHGAHEGFL
jgi:hypothetical protein